MPYYPEAGGILPGTVTNKYLADMPAGTVKGRTSASAGPPQDIAMPLSYRNILGRNGGFAVWQRGAGGSAGFSVPASTTQYIADGWCLRTSATNATNAYQGGSLVAASRYCAVIQRVPGQTGTSFQSLEFALDTDEIVPARGSIVTLSMVIQAGANFSPVGGTISVYLATGTGPPMKWVSGPYTTPLNVIDTTFAITATVTRYTATSAVVVPVGTTQATVLLIWTPTGTAGANDSFNITDVQLEVGNVATPFERRPFEQELLACQRHYQKSFSYGTAPATNTGSLGGATSVAQAGGAATSIFGWTVELPTSMRVSPTMAFYNPNAANAQARCINAGADCSGIAVWFGSSTSFTITGTTAAGSAVGNGNAVHWTADAGI